MEIINYRGIKILIDDEDFSVANYGKSLFQKPDGFIVVARKGKHTYLHRAIMPVPPGYQVDHINGDRADNRKENLRPATHAENQRNKPPRKGGLVQFKGVRVVQKKQTHTVKYEANITVDAKTHHLGGFRTKLAAAAAYDDGALRLHGKFAFLNFDFPCRKKK